MNTCINILLTTTEICWNSPHYAKHNQKLFYTSTKSLPDLKLFSEPCSHLPTATTRLKYLSWQSHEERWPHLTATHWLSRQRSKWLTGPAGLDSPLYYISFYDLCCNQSQKSRKQITHRIWHTERVSQKKAELKNHNSEAWSLQKF